MFVPVTAGRPLEQIDFLFASKSPFTWEEEKEYRKCMAMLQERINAQGGS